MYVCCQNFRHNELKLSQSVALHTHAHKVVREDAYPPPVRLTGELLQLGDGAQKVSQSVFSKVVENVPATSAGAVRVYLKVPEMLLERTSKLAPIDDNGTAPLGQEFSFQLAAQQASVELRVCCWCFLLASRQCYPRVMYFAHVDVYQCNLYSLHVLSCSNCDCGTPHWSILPT